MDEGENTRSEFAKATQSDLGLRRQIPHTEYTLNPVGLSVSTFGWKVAEKTAFQILDAFAGAGGNFITVSDNNASGRAEWMLGRWISFQRSREDLVIASRVAVANPQTLFTVKELVDEALASLERLQLDYVDFLVLPFRNPSQAYEEILEAGSELIAAGRVKHIAANAFTADQLLGARISSAQAGLPRFTATFNEYSLLRRKSFEGEISPVAKMQDLGLIAKHPLAHGFLSGSFRDLPKLRDVSRSKQISAYVDKQSHKLLVAMDTIADSHDCTLTEVALSWALHNPLLTALSVSALDATQISQAMNSINIDLSEEELSILDQASGAGGRLFL